MPRFDARIIQQYAQDLYDRADSLVWKAAASGALLGGFAGWILSFGQGWAGTAFPPMWVVIAAAGAGAVRAAIAAEREVFRLRLEAQQALCQLMIAENTRTTATQLQEMNLRAARGRSVVPDHHA